MSRESFSYGRIDRRSALAGAAGLVAAAFSGRSLVADQPDPSRLTELTFRDAAGKDRTENGRVLVRTGDGILLESQSGRLWSIESDQLQAESTLRTPFSPMTPAELGRTLTAESAAAGIEGDIRVTEFEHYVIASNTGKVWVEWTGSMLERLHDALRNFFKAKRLPLHDAEFPLPVIILSSRKDFARFAEFDRTPASAQGQGYYLVTGNRTVLYDLTSGEGGNAKNLAEVHKRVRENPATIASIIHEATHQIAFNCGLHRRYADNPVWLTEGMAMYFETPDLQSRRGWRTIGRVNRNRLARFVEFARTRRKADSLETLTRDNSRFADADTAIDAYAEAWALTHFLMKTRARDYIAYLKLIGAKKPLRWENPETRIADFQAAFGDDPNTIGKQLLTFIRRI